MKLSRLGMTESGLLLLHFTLYNVKLPDHIQQNVIKSYLHLANWLYTCAGYYDKNVPGSNFNFNIDSIKTKNWMRYMNELGESVSGCEKSQFYFHEGFITNLFNNVKDIFIKHYNIDNFEVLNGGRFVDRLPFIYKNMEGKKILTISSFSKLMKQQYDNGNVYKLGIEFPNVKSVDSVVMPYCFTNTGPHQNYFETFDSLFEEIKTKDFDIAVLGCGCYGHSLVHKIHTELGKDAMYVGGCVPNLFGILGERERNVGMGQHVPTNEFWVLDIPLEYRPTNYKAVENGCYW